VGLPSQDETFDLLSRGSVRLQPRAIVTGSVVAGGNVDVQPLAQVLGDVEEGAAFGPQTTLTIDLNIPPPAPGLRLQPHEVAALAPGSYDELRLAPWSRVNLQSGRYYFEKVSVGPHATIQMDALSGLTTMFVATDLDFKGRVAVGQGPQTFFIGYLGSSPATLSGEFGGTVVAPNSALRLGPGLSPGYQGSFLGKQLEVGPNSSVTYVPFLGWADLLGEAAPPPTLDYARSLPGSCETPHLCCPTAATVSGYGDEDDRHDITQDGECVLTAGGDDTISGIKTGSVAGAGAGADVIRVGQGGTAYGGDGDDTIETLGSSIVFGNAGDDTIRVPCGSGIVFPGPGRDSVEMGPGDDVVVVNDACELAPGEKLLAGAGHDVLVSPLTLPELAALGVEVEGFEEVTIERHPCQSECRHPPTCSGVGQCVEDPVSLQLACECPSSTQGANCEQANAPPFASSPPPSLGGVPAGQEQQAARAFLDWFGNSSVGDSPAARAELDAGYPNRTLRQAFVDVAADLVQRPRTDAGIAAIEAVAYLRCVRCEALLKDVTNMPVPVTGTIEEGEHGAPTGTGDELHVVSLQTAAVSALGYVRTASSKQFLLDTVSNHPRLGTRLAAAHALITVYGPAIRPDLLARLPVERHLEAFRFPNGAPDFAARLLEFANAAGGN
jgi:hypothetical protein